MDDDRIMTAAQAWAEERESGTHTSAMRALDTFQRVLAEEMDARVAAAVAAERARIFAALRFHATNRSDLFDRTSDREAVRLAVNVVEKEDATPAPAPVGRCTAMLRATFGSEQVVCGNTFKCHRMTCPMPEAATPPREPDEAGVNHVAAYREERAAAAVPDKVRDIIDAAVRFVESGNGEFTREKGRANFVARDDLRAAVTAWLAATAPTTTENNT